jgi:hypothetical protein
MLVAFTLGFENSTRPGLEFTEDNQYVGEDAWRLTLCGDSTGCAFERPSA